MIKVKLKFIFSDDKRRLRSFRSIELIAPIYKTALQKLIYIRYQSVLLNNSVQLINLFEILFFVHCHVH